MAKDIQYIAKRFVLCSGNHKKYISDKDKSKESLKTVYMNLPETLENP